MHEEADARRIEARRIEIEQEPNPPEVLQYASPPLDNIPWTPFGLSGDPEVSQEDLWRVLGRDVDITYDDMNQFMNEEREESSSSSDDDNGGAGGEEDIPVPQILIALKRGRRSTSGSGFVVNVKGKFDILIYIM